MTVLNNVVLQCVQNILLPQTTVAQNVFHCTKVLGSTADNDVIVAVAEWMELMYANVDSNMADSVSLGSCVVSQWDSVGEDWDLVGLAAPSESGTDPAQMLPHGAAAYVRGVTSNPDVVGAKYLAGYHEDTQDDGVFAAGVTTNLALFGVDWQTTITAANGVQLKPGVWQRSSNTIFDLTGTITASGIVAYQRRRKQGVGI